MNEPDNARINAAAAVTTIARTGVWKREWTCARTAGSCPRSAIANSNRVAAVMEAPHTPAQAMTAASAIAIAPHGPTNATAASASGRSDVARSGSIPTQTIWIKVYRTTTLPTDSRIANGTERGALRTSPAITVVASKPKKANAANRMAVDISFAGGSEPTCRDCGSMKNRPTVAKTSRGISLDTVNAVLTAAVWRMPRMLTHAYASTTMLMVPTRANG